MPPPSLPLFPATTFFFDAGFLFVRGAEEVDKRHDSVYNCARRDKSGSEK
jgi:hypothetical protein